MKHKKSHTYRRISDESFADDFRTLHVLRRMLKERCISDKYNIYMLKGTYTNDRSSIAILKDKTQPDSTLWEQKTVVAEASTHVRYIEFGNIYKYNTWRNNLINNPNNKNKLLLENNTIYIYKLKDQPTGVKYYDLLFLISDDPTLFMLSDKYLLSYVIKDGKLSTRLTNESKDVIRTELVSRTLRPISSIRSLIKYRQEKGLIQQDKLYIYKLKNTGSISERSHSFMILDSILHLKDFNLSHIYTRQVGSSINIENIEYNMRMDGLLSQVFTISEIRDKIRELALPRTLFIYTHNDDLAKVTSDAKYRLHYSDKKIPYYTLTHKSSNTFGVRRIK